MTFSQFQSGVGLLALSLLAWACCGFERPLVVLLDIGLSSLTGLTVRQVASWALCGFTDFASVGIMVGGMTAMCPERRAEIVRLGLPAPVPATIACCMTGAVAGLLTAG